VFRKAASKPCTTKPPGMLLLHCLWPAKGIRRVRDGNDSLMDDHKTCGGLWQGGYDCCDLQGSCWHFALTLHVLRMGHAAGVVVDRSEATRMQISVHLLEEQVNHRPQIRPEIQSLRISTSCSLLRQKTLGNNLLLIRVVLLVENVHKLYRPKRCPPGGD
jgi:hypothetical protein